jgi:hypothetical protein
VVLPFYFLTSSVWEFQFFCGLTYSWCG